LSYIYPVYVIGMEKSENLFLCPAYAHAPPQFCHHVRNHLDREMAGRWIGRSGPIARTPRSPYLAPLGFFLWGCVKNIICQLKINDLQHLKTRVRDAMATVTTNILQVTWNEVEYRLGISHYADGPIPAPVIMSKTHKS
jgi:hypothetical protein